MPKAVTEYKDRLFNFLFGNEEHKDWTLELYNAVNNTDYKDVTQIQIATVHQILYMGMRNDVSFMISREINMYEQQSTYNPNMPLRMLQYAGSMYEKVVTLRKKNKYGKTLISLPIPKLIVFYNGTDTMPDETILHLADSFPENRRDEADISVRVRMININQGHSTKITEKCKPLGEYCYLVTKIREYEVEQGLESAIDKVIDTLPDNFVIKVYLEAHKAEVKNMLLTEYNEAKQMELFKEEGINEVNALN